MGTITVREIKYELVENEYASLNAILLFLTLLDPQGAQEFVGMNATLEELQKELAEKYDELSESGQKSIKEMSTRVMFALNADPEMFPSVISYRNKAYKYIKILVPDAPILDEQMAGTILSEFLLAIAIPESVKAKIAKNSLSTPNPSATTSKKKGKKSAEPPAEDNAEPTEDKAEQIIEKLKEGKDLSPDELATVFPDNPEFTDDYYKELLKEQEANTVVLIDKVKPVPDDIEEELGL
jgi:hypothetical protein